MRTTLTIDPDVAERLRQVTRRSGKRMNAVINEALRHGLSLMGKSNEAPRFVVKGHSFGFKPGIDLDRLNQFIDELELPASPDSNTRERSGR